MPWRTDTANVALPLRIRRMRDTSSGSPSYSTRSFPVFHNTHAASATSTHRTPQGPAERFRRAPVLLRLSETEPHRCGNRLALVDLSSL